jgi:hypothetical protein
MVRYSTKKMQMKKILFVAGTALLLACGKIKDVYTDNSIKYDIDWTAAADSSSTGTLPNIILIMTILVQ